MSAQLDNPLTLNLRDALNSLAAGLFNLDGWINTPGKYKPPLPAEDMPWRAPGHKFSPFDLGAIPFLEGLLRGDTGEDQLLVRWAQISASPLRNSPRDDIEEWRAARGLGDSPRFGIAQGANVLITDSFGHPVSRRAFYEACWPLLQAVLNSRAQKGPVDYGVLANDLATNQAAEWPRTNNPPSSVFVMQLMCDLLFAMLGMRNPVAPPMQYALLAELGEFRRAGNAFDPKDAAQGVAELRKLLEKLQAAPPPPPATAPIHPAVGSPPHDKQ